MSSCDTARFNFFKPSILGPTEFLLPLNALATRRDTFRLNSSELPGSTRDVDAVFSFVVILDILTLLSTLLGFYSSTEWCKIVPAKF